MSFGPTIKLTSDGLDIVLRPFWSAEEVKIFAPGISELIVNRYIGHRNGASETDEKDWFEKTRLNNDSVQWAIQAKDGQVIGATGLHGFDFEGRCCTSGIVIFDRKYWGKGVATLAHHGRTWFAANRKNAERIYSAVAGDDPINGQGNSGSARALCKVGYFIYGQKPYGHFMDGKFHRINELLWLNPRSYTRERLIHEGQIPEHLLDKATEALSRADQCLKRAEELIVDYIY